MQRLLLVTEPKVFLHNRISLPLYRLLRVWEPIVLPGE